MVAISVLGGLAAFLVFMVAGMWATIRVQREKHENLKAYVLHLESHERRAAQDADVPPHAIRFVSVPANGVADDNNDRATDVSEFLAFDLASMGSDRPTLT